MLIITITLVAVGAARQRRLRYEHDHAHAHSHRPPRRMAPQAYGAGIAPPTVAAPGPQPQTTPHAESPDPRVVVVAKTPPAVPGKPRRKTPPAVPDIEKHTKYTVVGVDKASGLDTQIVVDAVSPHNAKVKAQLKGVVVTNVHRA